MKSRIINNAFIIPFIIPILLQSCDKHLAKKLSGTYNCQVHYEYWDMSPNQIDSTYHENLEVIQDGKYVSILNQKIHIDSLSKEKEYHLINVNGSIKAQFKNDSLYFTISGGGLGENTTYTYKGKKK